MAGYPTFSFGKHMLAVLGAAASGATVFSTIWIGGLMIAVHGRLPGATGPYVLALLFWLALFIVALPAAGLLLSLLYPIIRHRSWRSDGIVLLAGATAGIVLAPLSSPKLHGTAVLQLTTHALIGIGICSCYIVLAAPLGRIVAFRTGAGREGATTTVV